MDDLNAHIRSVLRVSLLLLSASLVVWAVASEFRAYAAGFALGLVVSLVNSYYLGMKIRQMTILLQSPQSKRFNLGFLTRAALAVLTVMLASKVDGINMYATIVGLFSVQGVALMVGFVQLVRRKS